MWPHLKPGACALSLRRPNTPLIMSPKRPLTSDILDTAEALSKDPLSPLCLRDQSDFVWVPLVVKARDGTRIATESGFWARGSTKKEAVIRLLLEVNDQGLAMPPYGDLRQEDAESRVRTLCHSSESCMSLIYVARLWRRRSSRPKSAFSASTKALVGIRPRSTTFFSRSCAG